MNSRSVFRIFYGSFFGILIICLTGLLIITPGDAIHQALSNNQIYNVFVIAGCYFVTGVLACLIYASRWYTNRSVLAAIPKTYIPIEKGDVDKSVRKMIVSSLNRSAAIAWDSRPRVNSDPPTIVSEPDKKDPVAKIPESEVEKKRTGFFRKRPTEKEEGDQTIEIPPSRPVWGEISHDGWASPESPDHPDLEYITVILELPHLIEAKAVSFAPPDPHSTSNPPLPNLQAVDLLQRPATMGLRSYITQLISLQIISSPAVATNFLKQYEYARFSTRSLSEIEFRNLMKLFADLLRCMQSLSPAILASLDIDPPESDIDDDNSSTPRSRSLVSARSARTRSGSEGTIRTAPSRRLGTTATVATEMFPDFRTPPFTPGSRIQRSVSGAQSVNSFAQSKRPYNEGSGSSTSLSSSQGSVIRLRDTNEPSELPYVLTSSRTP